MPAMETLTQPEQMKGLQVAIPASVHEQLRVAAAKENITMGAIVAEAVVFFLEQKAA